jgi:hypothetical protein
MCDTPYTTVTYTTWSDYQPKSVTTYNEPSIDKYVRNRIVLVIKRMFEDEQGHTYEHMCTLKYGESWVTLTINHSGHCFYSFQLDFPKEYWNFVVERTSASRCKFSKEERIKHSLMKIEDHCKQYKVLLKQHAALNDASWCILVVLHPTTPVDKTTRGHDHP